jgi:hypothetical protein
VYFLQALSQDVAGFFLVALARALAVLPAMQEELHPVVRGIVLPIKTAIAA